MPAVAPMTLPHVPAIPTANVTPAALPDMPGVTVALPALPTATTTAVPVEIVLRISPTGEFDARVENTSRNVAIKVYDERNRMVAGGVR